MKTEALVTASFMQEGFSLMSLLPDMFTPARFLFRINLPVLAPANSRAKRLIKFQLQSRKQSLLQQVCSQHTIPYVQ